MRAIDTLHRLPTHLGVRDPVLWMLDEVQLLKIAAGVLLAAFIMRQAVLPIGVRAALSALALLGAAACALVRVEGRSLDEWLLVVGRYWARPRILVWRSRRPDHPWARVALGTEPTRRRGGCVIRHLCITWLEPEDSAELDNNTPTTESAANSAWEAVA